jgi:hypothetical protein
MRTIIVLCTVILTASHHLEYAQNHALALTLVGVFAFIWDVVEFFRNKI